MPYIRTGNLVLLAADERVSAQGRNQNPSPVERWPDLLERVDPIFRSSRTDGMGLGLSLCRRIIEGWGGELEMLNGPRGGALIRFGTMEQSEADKTRFAGCVICLACRTH